MTSRAATGARDGIQRLLFSAVLVATSGAASAQPMPTSVTGRYSAYEEEAIRHVAVALGAGVDPSPEGKLIERIDVLALDPVEPRDPLPGAMNALHVSTRPFVVERELLLARGDRYSKLLADESARKLRTLPQLSVVVCVAFSASTPQRVRWVVITKDVWSLLLDFSTEFGNTGSGYFRLEPKESNLLGTHQEVLARLSLNPGSYGFGAAYRVPRLAGTGISLVADANVILNRQRDTPEGSYGMLKAVQPLRTNRAEWAWFSEVSWRREVTRSFGPHGPRQWQSREHPEFSVPYVWQSQSALARAALMRSFGWAIKNDLTLSASGRREVHRLPQGEARNANARRQFEQSELPANDWRVGPNLEWHGYASDFLRTHDLETLGLQEDYRLGHDVLLSVSPLWGGSLESTRRFVSVHAAAQETFLIGDGFARMSADWKADVLSTRATDSGLLLESAIVSPRLGFGRLIYSIYWLERFTNRRRQTDYLGGDNRLRGFGNNLLGGSNLLAMNLEYRTPGLELAELQFGAVAFLDSGAAFEHDLPQLQHSIGVGLRLVIPQISRPAFRLDFAFPIDRERGPDGIQPDLLGWQFGIGQAFDIGTVLGVSAPLVP